MRIMPPTLFWICILIMVPLAWVWPLVTVFPTPYSVIGIVPLCVGLWFAIWGSRRFEQVGTTIKTFDQPDRLVTDGLFRISRNPMYLGFALTLAGVWLVLGALSPLLGVLLFLVVADRWYIPFEERMLRAEFNGDYDAYCAQTRRWI
jgi:protein-S-isoprenylcysteine O-methyltransferase Ste14